MKAFWAVLLLLIAGSAAYLAFGRDGSRSVKPLGDAVAPALDLPPPPPRAPGQKDNDESAFFPEIPASAPPPAPAPVKPEATPAPIQKPDPVAPAPAPAPEPKEVAPAPAPKPEEAKPIEPKIEKPAVEQKPPAPAPASAPAAAPAPPAAPVNSAVAFGDDAKVVKNDDGSMLIDDKYPLKGEGTKEKPYQLTWEYLVSAQEDYQPRLGKKKLPGRMKIISGKYVKITGFVAFPVMATEPTEMLAMLNQWDGCCIGVPPTPYDAVEVKLKDPASNEQRLTTYGAVEGKLTVEPYLVRDWLVSLYSMDEAKMERAQ